MGALNANVFATGKLCAAASKRHYLPAVLGNMHIESAMKETEYYERILQRLPRAITSRAISFAEATADLRLAKEVPMLAITKDFRD